jgi:hypothetical protein
MFLYKKNQTLIVGDANKFREEYSMPFSLKCFLFARGSQRSFYVTGSVPLIRSKDISRSFSDLNKRLTDFLTMHHDLAIY